ncbi:thiosulfate sulfurtransferase/rhodanese-like domain-containing protein 3 isoform X2 [Pristis pectinata]|uniref:thiosulfate sulfurtransferase/rhodanese-like domain-containing protein 3 isoform X2 n=1 Tax=Pristis pectinata TaxID=685728 RepID=UPI00223E5559|nr:thiosulfate sulfurtransferase/rhodanese-like domain-containing protein 3 isoform X2 [Pristis pectinata]
MGRVLGLVSALLLRAVSRASAVEVCRQQRRCWAPVPLSQPKTHYSVCTVPPETVTYQELKQLLKSNKIFLIDVRESWELKEYGQIPGSINVPLGQVEQTLQLDPKGFMEIYNKQMPTTSDKIVFSCLGGVRSKKALDTAISLGYSRAVHFPGGWEEWETRELSEKKG